MKPLSLLTALMCSACAFARADDATNDPNLWLEDVMGDKPLNWVRQQNSLTTQHFENSSGFQALDTRLLTILDSPGRIPSVAKHGKFFYNFWRDKSNPRGLWRRTTLEEYKKPDPQWETVLDIDKLAADEKTNWVWEGENVLEPENDRCLIHLSHGGADAVVVREFNLTTKQFIAGGFELPEAKTDVTWRNRDTLYVGTDFGPGSLTASGYPRQVKEWRRGTPLSAATLVFEGDVNDVGDSAYVVHDHGHVYDFISRGTTFFTDQIYLRQGDKWVRIEKPDDVTVSTFDGHFLFTPRSDWNLGIRTYPSGSLLMADMKAWLKGDRHLDVLFAPTERISLDSVAQTKHCLLLTVLDNVRSRAYSLQPTPFGWQQTPIETPDFGAISIEAIDPEKSDDYFITTRDFLTPTTLFLGNAVSGQREKLKSLPELFNAAGLTAQQFEATSKDGTRIPYFLVTKKDMKLDGSNITLLTGYGGFEIAMLPNYNPTIGAAWLERGGVYVLANIRGGGEFGPAWHNAARKEHRQRAYDDFIAIGEDLIKRGVTTSAHLGIEGRSNGGLLMGVMLTERPDLWGAVHIGSPLLDMRRYTKLPAGASWIDEYGDPDRPEDWAYIQKFSPYQNIHPGKYPPVLITTSTRDDRVHPGHARKMARRLEGAGHKVWYYENIEGGHGAAADNKQSAFMSALAYEFLWQALQ